MKYRVFFGVVVPVRAQRPADSRKAAKTAKLTRLMKKEK